LEWPFKQAAEIRSKADVEEQSSVCERRIRGTAPEAPERVDQNQSSMQVVSSLRISKRPRHAHLDGLAEESGGAGAAALSLI
jgi:hypothetical protein